jgi:RNA-binding protein YlmH
LPRGVSGDLSPARRVFINGRTCLDGSALLREGDLLTARGYGRLRYAGVEGLSRKGKQNTVIEKFV